VIDSIVEQVILDESGNIQSILLDNQNTIYGDLFIDCSGFAKILSNAVGAKWVSYKNNLLMNSALPFQLNYEPPCDVEPVSIATALSAGWFWQLSLADRWGCGYVFCDQFINFNQAQQEIENFIGEEITPIKQIKFDPGRLDRVWIKNCVSLGLASAFVEPLEATSIHTTIMQIQKLSTLLKNEITDKDINDYNNEVATAYDEIKEFIVLHYMGGRDDSEFWRTVSSQTCTDFVRNILNIAKHRLLTAADIPNKNTNISYQAWNQTLAGLGLFSKETVSNHLKDKNIKDQYYKWKTDLTTRMEQCKSIDDILENGKFKL
jgi:tryptophan halogenase